MTRNANFLTISRRRALATGAAFSASLLAGTHRAVGQATPETTSATPQSGTRIVETVNGPVDVPAQPARVICLDSYSAASLVDAGLIPIGVPELGLETWMPVYQEALSDVPVVGPYTEPDPELLLELDPDLILSINTPWVVDLNNVLEEIAPTVLFDYNIPNAWMTLADQFSGAVGRTAEMEEFKQRYADRATDLGTTHADVFDSTVWGVAIGWGAEAGQFTLYYPDSAPGVVLDALGVQWVEAAAGKTGTSERVSYEQLNVLADADVILTYGTTDGVPEESSQQMIDQPLFQALPAAQQDQVFALQLVVPASYGQALGLLDGIEGILAEL